MFSGIGGFELGIQRAFDRTVSGRQGKAIYKLDKTMSNPAGERTEQSTCIGYSEIDKYAIKVYERQFGRYASESNKSGGELQGEKRQHERPELHPESIGQETHNIYRGHKNYGDATAINATDLPDFDLLVGGFPCQAFSVAGKRAGFNDTRGTLFFDIARILKEKQPRHLVLENVKGLLSHDGGRTFTTIIGVLTDLGYLVEWQVLNSKDFGVPQNRERVFIVGHLGGIPERKVFPIIKSGQSHLKYSGGVISAREQWLKDGNNNSRNFSQGQRIYSTDGISQTLAGQAGGQGGKTGLYELGDARIRRLTPLECERLQGFPDGWTKYGEDEHGMRVDISDSQRYKMCGNAVTVNTVQAVMERLFR